MIQRYRPAQVFLGLFVGVTGLLGTTTAKADVPWADNHYGYRRPLSISTNVGAAMNAGDIVAYAFAPNAGPFLNKTRPDGQDVKVIYSPDGATNVEPNQMLLSMGTNARVLFALQAAVPAPLPYTLTETVSGKTAFDSLPTGAAITFAGQDDSTVTKTLPFPVTLRDRTSNQITIAIDGYVGLGATDPGRPDLTNTGGGSYILMPFQSDLAITGTGGQGVFYDVSADNTTVTIKWVVQASSGTIDPMIAEFACVLKSDGTIRYVYGDPCQMPAYYDFIADPAVGYDPVRFGIGVGDASKSKITQPAWDAFDGVKMTGHNDITYTQTSTTQSIPGYWVYYGYDADTGARTPPTAGIQGCDFSDGQLHGWKSINMPGLEGTSTADVRINSDASFGNELRFEGGQALPMYFLPFMYWGDMTPVANAISYVKLRSNGQHGVLQRFNTQTFTSSDGTDYPAATDVPALGAAWNNWGAASPLVSSVEATESNWKGQMRRRTNPDAFGSSISYNQPSITAYQYNVLSTFDNGSNHTVVNAKAWPSNEVTSEPSSWIVSGDSSTKSPAVQPLPAGQLALYNYSTVLYVKWAYVLSNPYAESLSYTPGAEAAIVLPPAVIKGTVIERFSHAPQVGANVTLFDTSGNYVKSTLTDTTGSYSFGIPNGGTFNVGVTVTAGYGARTTSPVTVGSGQTFTQNLVADVLVNGDMEIPNATNTKPDCWDWATRWPGTVTTDTFTYTREQNHTPGGAWSLKFQNPNPQGSGTPDNMEITAGSGTNVPLIPCDVTLSAWVRSDTADLGVRIRTFTAGWEGAGANGDGSANGGGQWKRFKASPNLAAGELPLNTWVQITTTNHYGTNPVTGINICLYGGDYLNRTVSGNVYVDDVAITVTPKYQIITQVVDDLGQPIASPWLGTMLYGTLFSNPTVGLATGRKYDYFYTATPVTYAAWQGPLSRAAAGLDAGGALVGTRTITPTPYDAAGLPTATLLVSRKAVNVLGGTNTTTGLVNGDSQWPSYLIDKRILKTTSASPGDDSLGDSTNPADWVQVQRNAAPVLAGRLWDANINDEAHGWGSGGLRGILSSGVDAAPSTNDVPTRYRTATVDIDMGATQSIDQIEFGYFFNVQKHRIWITDTPLVWNVELPDSQAVVNTTTDSVSVATLGFTSTNKPYDGGSLSSYQIYRLPAPATGRYMRIRQDGAPYGDGHQILLELRAMHSTAIVGADVTSALRIAAGLQAGPLNTDPQFARLDVNNNGKIDILDAVKLSQSVAR